MRKCIAQGPLVVLDPTSVQQHVDYSGKVYISKKTKPHMYHYIVHMCTLTHRSKDMYTLYM